MGFCTEKEHRTFMQQVPEFEHILYEDESFSKTHTSYSPWIVVRANDKKKAGLESIRYTLSALEFEGKSNPGTNLYPDPDIVIRYDRPSPRID